MLLAAQSIFNNNMHNVLFGGTDLAVDVAIIECNHIKSMMKGVPKWENDFSIRTLLKSSQSWEKIEYE